MPVSPETTSLFFLTHQSANIIEDLTRSLHQKSIVNLIFGEPGVGKSRLIQQFTQTRLSENQYVWISFDAQGQYQYVLGNQPLDHQRNFMSKVMSDIPDQAILILDHFEYAISEIKTRVFRYMEEQGKHTQIKLIICSSSDNLSDLSEFSKRFQVEVSSVELKCLTFKEQISYLESIYCNGLRTRLKRNSNLRKILKPSKGLFASLVALPQKQPLLICEARASLDSSLFSAKWAISLLVMMSFFLLVLNGGGGNVLHKFYSDIDNVPEQEEFSVAPSMPINKVDAQSALVEATANELINTDSDAPHKSQRVDAPSIISSSNADQMLDGLKKERDSVSVDHENTIVSSLLPEAGPDETASPVQHRIDAMQKWLSRATPQQATIQIMSLAQSNGSEKSLNRYLNNLQNQSIDTSKIFIYSSIKKNKKMIGVLYGIYQNREKAITNIVNLPDILKANKPIPRTVKGIKDEINSSRLLE